MLMQRLLSDTALVLMRLPATLCWYAVVDMLSYDVDVCIELTRCGRRPARSGGLGGGHKGQHVIWTLVAAHNASFTGV